MYVYLCLSLLSHFETKLTSPSSSQILYPFFVFAHVPAQLFLDYNLLYLLVQLGFHPSLPSASSPTLITRALVDVPNIKASTGWWVAVGIYSVCTAVWFFGVVCWREVLQAIQKGGGAGKAFEIEKVYTGSAYVFPFPAVAPMRSY